MTENYTKEVDKLIKRIEYLDTAQALLIMLALLLGGIFGQRLAI